MSEKIPAPKGHVWLARRLNRHPYHLARKGSTDALCGKDDEHMDRAMPHFLNNDESTTACAPCLAKTHKAAPATITKTEDASDG